jgi:hypothetical protein
MRSATSGSAAFEVGTQARTRSRMRTSLTGVMTVGKLQGGYTRYLGERLRAAVRRWRTRLPGVRAGGAEATLRSSRESRRRLFRDCQACRAQNVT